MMISLYKLVRKKPVFLRQAFLPALYLFMVSFTGRAATSETMNIRAIRVSSEAPACPSPYAADGNLDTYWEAGETDSPQWVEIELDTVYYLTRVQQIFNQSSVWKFTVEASKDGQLWTSLVDKSKSAAGICFAESVHGQYQYIRLTVLGSADNYPASSREFSVTGRKDGINLIPLKGKLEALSAPYCEASKAGDNDVSTYWCAANGSYPQLLKVDLEEPFYITHIQQVFKDYDNWRFRIEASVDKIQWTVVVNQSSGADGCEFTADINDTYRYFRLIVLGSSQGYWSNSCELRIFGYRNDDVGEALPPDTTRWWQNTSGLSRYYTKLYNYRLQDITADLDHLKSQGYNILELMCPYEGKADIWAGLGATDNYAIDPSIGTMDDFEDLIRQAHARDMRIVFFGNIGYCRDEAPFFQKACDDERNDVYSKERQWFHFSDTQIDNRWFWSERAQAWYYSYWGNTDGAAGRIPSYNFNHPEWQDEVTKYLRFWADKGIDGLFIDAPDAYHGINDVIIDTVIARTLNQYGLLTNAEGSADIDRWFGRFHYNCIQGFDLYGWGGGKRSEVLAALRKNSPSGLNDRLKGYRDKATHMNGITLTPPMWEIQATTDERLFETAYLVSMGTLFANHCGDYRYVAQDIIPTWTPESQNRFYTLLQTQSSYRGLAPSGQRTQLPSNNDNRYAAFKRSNRDGNVSALAIFNFQPYPSDVTVSLTHSGIRIPQQPVDLLTGRAADPIRDAAYTVSLPAYGYLLLGVENGFGQTTGTTAIKHSEPGRHLEVYPNPFTDHLTVRCPYGLKNIRIYSLSGLLVREYTAGNTDRFEINGIGLPPGMYILKATDVNHREEAVRIICNE
jgi:hypothetical protein